MKLTRRNYVLAYLLLLPSFLFIASLNLIPLVEGFIVSLQRQELMRPADANEFVWFANYYRALFEEGIFWGSLWRTIVWTLGSVIGSYVVGLILAMLLNQDIRGRGLFRALLLIPWVMPNIVASLLWKWMYNDEFGVFNYVLREVGMIDEPIRWLADLNLAMPSIIVVQVWKLYPVTAVVLLAALQSIPIELYEAGTIDGASGWQNFRHITFPLIRPTSIVITLLLSIWSFNHFDLVYLLTGGGPANRTMVLATLVYNKAFFALNMGYGSALGVLMLLTLSVFGVLYLRAYTTLEV